MIILLLQVSDFIMATLASKMIPPAVLKALPTRRNLEEDMLHDPDALISEVTG